MKKILNERLFFETKFYTVNDIINRNCPNEVLKLTHKFTDDIILELRDAYCEDTTIAFRFIFTGHSYEDIAYVRLYIYEISADINRGLNADIIRKYNIKEITFDEIQKLLNVIELPSVSTVTSEKKGLKVQTKEYFEEIEKIEYSKVYYEPECECYIDHCNCEPTWDYDYDNPIGVRIEEVKYTEDYLVLDLIDEDDLYMKIHGVKLGEFLKFADEEHFGFERTYIEKMQNVNMRDKVLTIEEYEELLLREYKEMWEDNTDDTVTEFKEEGKDFEYFKNFMRINGIDTDFKRVYEERFKNEFLNLEITREEFEDLLFELHSYMWGNNMGGYAIEFKEDGRDFEAYLDFMNDLDNFEKDNELEYPLLD